MYKLFPSAIFYLRKHGTQCTVWPPLSEDILSVRRMSGRLSHACKIIIAFCCLIRYDTVLIGSLTLTEKPSVVSLI